MRKEQCKPKIMLLVSVLVIFSFPCLSHAVWYWTHGNSGQPAVDSSYTSPGLIVGGYNETVWVHYAVPTIDDTFNKVRYIKVRYTRANVAGQANLSAVHIYNGETMVKEFSSGWPPVSYDPPEPYELVLDLGTEQAFDKGLGVSIGLFYDMNSGSETITIHGVGANFESSVQAKRSGFYVIPVDKNP